jgi:hypothetical protein
MEALEAAHDAAVQMIDTSVVRVHQHGACIAGNREQHMGRSRGGLTSKVHAVAGLLPKTMVLADRNDADWIRALVNEQGAWANIPPKRNRRDPICFSPYLYRSRNPC